jgi:hypothetical protein
MQAKNLHAAKMLLEDRQNFITFQQSVDESDVGDLKIQCANGGQVMSFPHDMIQAQISEWVTAVIKKTETELGLLGVTDLKDADPYPEAP